MKLFSTLESALIITGIWGCIFNESALHLLFPHHTVHISLPLFSAKLSSKNLTYLPSFHGKVSSILLLLHNLSSLRQWSKSKQDQDTTRPRHWELFPVSRRAHKIKSTRQSTTFKSKDISIMSLFTPANAVKFPNAKCSAPTCSKLCCDSGGHRVRTGHKARSCAVCYRWYCGTHKNKYLVQRLHSTVGVDTIYKCPGCVGTPRKSTAYSSWR